MAAVDHFEVTKMEPNLVEYRAENGIAFLTLNDPPANTYSYEMMQSLDRAILAARMDESVQVIVITGNGEKFFSAGANIQMLANVTPTFKYFFCLHANETLSRLEQTPKLVIAAINGHCVGGGLEVALADDIRIARRRRACRQCVAISIPQHLEPSPLPIIFSRALAASGGQRSTRYSGKDLLPYPRSG